MVPWIKSFKVLNIERSPHIWFYTYLWTDSLINEPLMRLFICLKFRIENVTARMGTPYCKVLCSYLLACWSSETWLWANAAFWHEIPQRNSFSFLQGLHSLQVIAGSRYGGIENPDGEEMERNNCCVAGSGGWSHQAWHFLGGFHKSMKTYPSRFVGRT